MDSSVTIALLGTAGLGSLALTLRFRPRMVRALLVRRLSNPAHDPGATEAGSTERERWQRFVEDSEPGSLEAAWQVALAETAGPEALLAAATFRHHGCNAGLVVIGLTLGHIRGLPWRHALGELPILKPTSGDEWAIEAERRLALGNLPGARQAAAESPPEHWRACRVRAALYALANDHERAESARHAARFFGPAEAAVVLARQHQQGGLGIR